MPEEHRPLPPVHTYGADAAGLICGWACRDDGSATALDCADAALPALADPQVTYVWLHFSLSHAGALPWLRRHAQLSDDFFDALESGSRATRIERDGAALFGVINDVTFDFGFEASDLATLWVSVARRLVVSARIHPLRRTGALTRAQCETLAGTVRDALTAGLAAGGATIDDFRHPDGVRGTFQDDFLVHRREGEDCPRCGGEIVKLVVAGRGTYVCERCQPRPRGVRRAAPAPRAARSGRP